ncbi:MAG: alpha/beta hydrolase [Gemmataceae bacterium]
MRRRKCLTWLMAIWTLAYGPLTARSEPSRRAEEEPDAIVVVIGGVGGLDILSWSVEQVLSKASLKYQMREYVWTHGWGQILRDLQDQRHMEAKARDLALLVRQLQARYPGKPIYFLAKSGGTGLALRAAELLPESTLERIVLLSAAVSPQYDLSGALRATRREIVSFHSSYDQFILNWGTSQFGTMDRVYGPSAGLHGFRLPGDADASTRDLYRRLVQVPWRPRMLAEWHTGGHAGNGFPAFLQAEVLPWLR